MIYRPIKFEALFDIGSAGKPEWKREPVVELLSVPQFGITSIKTTSGYEIELDPMKVSLLEFTGMFDREGMEIYHAHLLADDDGHIWQVIYARGCFMLNMGNDLCGLSEEICMKLKIVGDALQNAALLAPENPEQALEDSKKRNPPPLVTLNKKS